MSAELLIFDPAGMTDVPSDKKLLLTYISELLDADPSYQATQDADATESAPTTAIQVVMDTLVKYYGTLLEPKGGMPWSAWPPTTRIQGHHLTLNVDYDSVTDITMTLIDICEANNLILMDPQADEFFIYIPGGGGLV